MQGLLQILLKSQPFSVWTWSVHLPGWNPKKRALTVEMELQVQRWSQRTNA